MADVALISATAPARQHDRWVASAVPPLCACPRSSYPRKPGPEAIHLARSPCKPRSRSSPRNGRYAPPGVPDRHHIRRTYSAARVVRQEAESHSVTNAGRAPPCEIRRYARPASRHRFQLKGAYQALCELYGSQCHPRDRGLAADEDKAMPAFGEDYVRGYGRSACSVTRTIMPNEPLARELRRRTARWPGPWRCPRPADGMPH